MSDHEQDSRPAPLHEEGGALILDKPKSQEEIARQRREDEQHEFARSQVKTNKTLAWFTGALVVATFCTMGVGIWQGSISQTSAGAAKSAAATADATLKEMQGNDKATSEATLKAFRMEERAYVSVTNVTQSVSPVITGKNGNHYCVDVHFVNGGKTPAIGALTTAIVTYGSDAEDEEVVKSLKIPPYPRSIGSMNSTGVDFWITGCTIKPVDDPTLRLLLNNGISTYIYGVVQYRDIFGEYHQTGFCSRRSVGFTTFPGCPFGNWFDHK